MIEDEDGEGWEWKKEGKGEKCGVFGNDGWMSVNDDDVMEVKKRNGCILLWMVEKRE